MRFSRLSFHAVFLVLSAFFLSSCVSAPTDTQPAKKNVASLSELAGIWKLPPFLNFTEPVFLEYPFTAQKTISENKTFLKFSGEKRDDTERWILFAKSKGVPFSEIWQKRHAYLNEIYGENVIPAADENGCEKGIKVTLEENDEEEEKRIFSQRIVLVPESIAMQNLDCFLISSDGNELFLNPDTEFKFYSSFDLPLTEKKFSRQVGIVLSGGGGKGAYEVGVWKALSEFGVASRAVAISGTSVGGLNAALFATATFPYIESLWQNVVPNELTRDEKLISQKGLRFILDATDFSPIQTNAYPKIFITAVKNRFLPFKLLGSVFSSSYGKYASRFLLNEESDVEEIKRKLLATSAFPGLTEPVELSDGQKYVDGGFEQAGGDNTPIDPIVENCFDVDEIIVVYLSNAPERRIRKIDYDKKFIMEIIPSIDLGNIMEGTTNFDASRINLLINQGYLDTAKILRDDYKLRPVSWFWFN